MIFEHSRFPSPLQSDLSSEYHGEGRLARPNRRPYALNQLHILLPYRSQSHTSVPSHQTTAGTTHVMLQNVSPTETIGSMRPSLPWPRSPSLTSTNALGSSFSLSLSLHQPSSEVHPMSPFREQTTKNMWMLKGGPPSAHNGGMRIPSAYLIRPIARLLFAPGRNRATWLCTSQ